MLRPGGTFRLFDGYLERRPETFNADEALAAELVAKGVALERFQLVDDVVDTGRAVGLESRGVTSLDAEIAPNLRKLERLTGAVIRFPWLGRRALARRSPMRGRNVITGYLMHSTVALGAHRATARSCCTSPTSAEPASAAAAPRSRHLPSRLSRSLLSRFMYSLLGVGRLLALRRRLTSWAAGRASRPAAGRRLPGRHRRR